MTTHHWLDRNEYPFTSRYLDTKHGRVHYVDEGQGDPVVFVHGNPTWSFMFRKLISGLSSEFRCVAIDHLGFGLSDKPPHAPYGPRLHAENLTHLIRHLGLERITLVLHDWGGPIGMEYAVDYPESIARLVIFNTHCWSLKGIPGAERFSAFVGGPIGRWLCRRLNAFPRFIMPFMYAGTGRMSPEVHRHYLAPLPDADSRNGTWAFAKAIIGESDWKESTWSLRGALAHHPVRIFWGLKDPVGTQEKLDKWTSAFPRHEVSVYSDIGHFVPEQLGELAVEPIRAFLKHPLETDLDR